MGLISDVGSGPVGIDTVAFIYFIEEHPDYVGLLTGLFKKADSGSLEIITSAITLLEVLVVPFRAGDSALAHRYEQLLSRSRGLTLVYIDGDQLRAAAQLRAVHKMRTPDALQLTAALSRGCTAFVTNDRDMPPIPGLRVCQLSDYA